MTTRTILLDGGAAAVFGCVTYVAKRNRHDPVPPLIRRATAWSTALRTSALTQRRQLSRRMGLCGTNVAPHTPMSECPARVGAIQPFYRPREPPLRQEMRPALSWPKSRDSIRNVVILEEPPPDCVELGDRSSRSCAGVRESDDRAGLDGEPRTVRNDVAGWRWLTGVLCRGHPAVST